MDTERKNELIHAIGELILSDPPTEGMEWNKLALVVTFEPFSQSISGFYYDAFDKAEPATVNDFAIVEKVAELRQAMAEPSHSLWHSCLIQLVHATRRIILTFEYDDPERWYIGPKTLQHIKAAICPPDDL